MKYVLLLLTLALRSQSIWCKGAPWSTKDQDIIFEKLKYVIENPQDAFRQYCKLHPGYELPGLR